MSESLNSSELLENKFKLLLNYRILQQYYPSSVYRLQFNDSFTFKDASDLVRYLNEMGITDCYDSPYFKARTGSQHGYDLSDHNTLNPEIGSLNDYHKFVKELEKYQMKQILDFVPNHMSIFDNPKWQDVLENGPSSIYARYFDIDWHPVKYELNFKVLLPILEDLYGNVLENGQIKLIFKSGVFYIEYRNLSLPVGPKTIIPVLESSLNRINNGLPESDNNILEFQSIITASKNLPEQKETDTERMSERHREKEIIKKRLRELCQNNNLIEHAIQDTIKQINGKPGENESYKKLHDILEKQGYRLAFWRVAGDEINYRRFFDINELVALRMEDPQVFTETHRLLLDLYAKEMISGIRIDHVDGLFDPQDYLWRLQKACRQEWFFQKLSNDPELKQIDPDDLRSFLREKTNSDNQKTVYIVAEKILAKNERLNQNWPINGTTGYDFMNRLNQLFVDAKNSKKIISVYKNFISKNVSFENIAYHSKNLVMQTTMASEINLLAHRLDLISEKSWQNRDYTLNSIRDAIREVIACFPVYRTYINAYTGLITQTDKEVIEFAAEEAKRRNPAVSASIFDFIRNTLLLEYPVGMDASGRDQQRMFVMRFQQYTGPVMAKGMEDTAFYIYNPLISLNEVGADPCKFGLKVVDFHEQNILRQQNIPHSFISTSTHDSKRGEDVRARINVLSEIPSEWESALIRWKKYNKSKKQLIDDDLVPDANEEYFLYQTLLGTYPDEEMDNNTLISYCSRIQQYMLKAVKEAKVHSSWISPNTSYEEALIHFINELLQQSHDNQFLNDFKSFNRITALCGVYNSLSQVVLKLFSPGVPDIYQGNELLIYSLTDPDNRLPVDYEKRLNMLNTLKSQASNKNVLKDLFEHPYNGQIKMYITWKSLNFRKDNRAIFEGKYLPLKTAGFAKNHLCAFARINENKIILVIVPRLVSTLTDKAKIEPLGEKCWKDTRIMLPIKFRNRIFRNLFTDEILNPSEIKNSCYLLSSEVFTSSPVAVLYSTLK